MARFSGMNGKFKIGAAFITGVRSFEITETAATVDTTAAGEAWDSHVVTRKSWSGSVTVLVDHSDAAQDLRAGASAVIEGYHEGDASTKVYFTGTATVTSVGRPHQFDGETVMTVEITGNGSLDRAVVA